MLKINTPVIRTVALAAFAGSLAFASPVHAQTADTAQPAMEQAAPAPSDQTTTSSTTTTTSTTSMKGKHGMMGGMNVEGRIKTLHDKLQISAAQENDWNTVAQTMRENEASIHQLIEARHQDPNAMTAVDDLQSYQKIAQAHADGLQKLEASFATVYNEMSDSQKQNADMVFGKFEGHDHGMHSKKHSS
jgi:protein CpxP